MKFMPLIWAGVWRKPVRTAFTILSIVFAFMLFGLLRSVDAGFDNLIAHAEDDLIFVQARFFPQQLPMAYVDRIAHLAGVKEVSYQAFIRGYYRDPKTFFFVGGASPNMLPDLYDSVEVSKDALDALRAKPNGVLITPAMASHLGGVKVGDHIPFHSDVRQKNGSQDWDVEVVGLMDNRDTPGVFMFSFGNFDYVNEARAEPRNVIDQIGVRIADRNKGLETARAIDALFLNSGTPTRSTVQRAGFESAVSSLGNFKLMVNGIMTAVFFVLLLLTATTLAQSSDERVGEFAVLKTLGFSDDAVFAFIVCESLAQCAVGAALGLSAATFISPRMQGKLPGPPVFFHVPVSVYELGALAAVAIAVVAAAVPALRVRRLQIVDALAKR
jgi:putative ABC transport system permease protein